MAQRGGQIIVFNANINFPLNSGNHTDTDMKGADLRNVRNKESMIQWD